MGYLRRQDYELQIQDDNFDQITSSVDTNRLLAEGAAVQEVISYLVQKYDTDHEFAPITTFSMTANYYAEARVQLDASAYAQAVYALNALTLHSGIVYICTTAITTPEAFN